MKACPYCAEQIQDAAVVCRFCGRDLVITADPNVIAEGERATILSKAIQHFSFGQTRLEGQTSTQVVLVHGGRVNHAVHFLLGIPTMGLWWIIWFFVALTSREERMLVTVNERGVVERTDMTTRRVMHKFDGRGWLSRFAEHAAPQSSQQVLAPGPAPPKWTAKQSAIGIVAFLAFVSLIAVVGTLIFDSGRVGNRLDDRPLLPVERRAGLTKAPDDVPAASRNVQHARLTAFSETERRAAFTRILEDENCGRVTRTFLQGFDDETKAFWNAECSRGTAFMLSVSPDDKDNKLLDCALVKVLKLTPCFTAIRR